MPDTSKLSDYFVAAGAKTLMDTEVNPEVSNGHELQGIARFRQFLGQGAERETLPVNYVWLEDDEAPVSIGLTATWYDSRKNQAGRSAEYRFYYPPEAEDVVYKAQAGDTLILCQPRSGPLLALFCRAESSVERQLLWLFDLPHPNGAAISERDLRKDTGRDLNLVGRYILELLEIEVVATEERLLEKLLETFGARFPPTRQLSQFARDNMPDVDGRLDPDGTLMAWMELEERLFMTLEKHIVGERLLSGFFRDGQPDVETFVKFSLGVQNRRKSRAGWAFGNHIEALLRRHDLAFTREATTEKRSGPDFLFPGEANYHNEGWPAERLTMLAAKTSCKDRWRQVLTEADRIAEKHLLTLEPSISVRQTSEMRKERLQLVVPSPIHETYLESQKPQLMSVAQFIELVRLRQKT